MFQALLDTIGLNPVGLSVTAGQECHPHSRPSATESRQQVASMG